MSFIAAWQLFGLHVRFSWPVLLGQSLPVLHNFVILDDGIAYQLECCV